MYVFILQFVLAAFTMFPQAAAPPPAQSQQPAANQPKPSPARLSGRVLRDDSGLPLAKATIVMFPDGRPQDNLSARTNRSGSFEFPEVSPGRYRLRAHRNGFVAQPYGARGGGPGVVLVVEAGQRLEKIEFRLLPAGVITGNVRDEDNEPVEGVEVRALRARFSAGGQLETVTARTARTDDLGNYRLPGLAPGAYYVQTAGMSQVVSVAPQNAVAYTPAFYPGSSTQEEAQRVQVTSGVESRGVDLAITSGPSLTITGIVLDPDSGSSPRSYSAGITRSGGTSLIGLSRGENSFRMTGLAPGTYTLVASAYEQSKMTRTGYRTVRLVDSDVHVVLDLGRSAELAGELRASDGQPLPMASLYLRLVPNTPEASPFVAPVEEKGVFRISNVPEGRYWIRLQGRESELYLKEARCAGDDYTSEQITLAAAQVVDNCTIVVSRDVGDVSGTVTHDTKPVSGQVVVLIPVEKERRRNPRHTSAGQTDPAGLYQIRGVLPGDYFVFALPPSDDAIYYDLDFHERNRERATRLTVKPSERHVLNLTSLRPQ